MFNSEIISELLQDQPILTYEYPEFNNENSDSQRTQ